MMEDQIQLIALELIDRPVKISRELIDPERVRELAESIRESGLLQPVVLRPVNGRFETVAGDRRYLAHKLLGLKTIKAIVRELDDHETVILRGIENLQRENLTPSEEAKVYLLLHDEGGLSQMEIAKKCGKARQTIVRYLNFAVQPEEVRRAVDQKRISILALETLLEIEDHDAFMYHFEMAAANGVTEKVARMWVDDYKKSQAGKFYEEGGGSPMSNDSVEVKPVYITCECCHGPAEIRNVRHLVVCKECADKVKQGGHVKT